MERRIEVPQLADVRYALPKETDKPPVVFVHGFRGSGDGWHDSGEPEPEEEPELKEPEDAGWHWHPPLLPLRGWHVWSPVQKPFKGLYELLEQHGYPVVSWTQTDSVGEIPGTARELRQVVVFAKELYQADKVILVAHSRGGLVCREYLRLYRDDDDVLALITLGTPHKGTRLSNIDDFVAEIAVELLDRVPQVQASKIAINAVVHQLLALWEEFVDISQEAEWWDTPNEYLQELIPASTREDIRYVAIAGTNPDLAECYLLGYDLMSFIPQLHQPPWRWTRLAWHVATVTEDLGGIPIPQIEGLHETQDGQGDGVIARESAQLDEADNVVNLDFPASHSLLRHFDAVHTAVLEELDTIVARAET